MAAVAEKQKDILYVKMLGGFSMSFNGKTIAGSSKSSISQNNALLHVLIFLVYLHDTQEEIDLLNLF